MESLDKPLLVGLADLLKEKHKHLPLPVDVGLDKGLNLGKGTTFLTGKVETIGIENYSHAWETYNLSVDEVEALQTKVQSRLEAEAILRKLGINTSSKNQGELMMLAAQYGYVNIIRFYEQPSMYPITY